MESHPAASIYPKMSEEDLKLLAEDIKANGQRELIKTLDGKILEGRNRWEACKIAGVAPQHEEVKTDQPLSYTHSYNVSRRHLTGSQRAMIAARELEYLKKHPGEKGLSYERIAKDQDVAKRTVRRAKVVMTKGSEDLKAEVESGEMSVKEAEQIARLSKAQQQEVLKKKAKDRAYRKKYKKKAKTTPMKGAKAQLHKDARLAFGQLVRSIHSLGLFEELYDHLEQIRARLEG